MNRAQQPVVLVIGGNDPVGGAGLCADIQALARLGCHAAPVVTAVTRQTTCGVRGFIGIDPDLVGMQIDCVLEDVPVAAVKTGMLVSQDIVERTADALSRYPELPLVIDPVLASNMGDDLSEHSLISSLCTRLASRARVLTPNLPELVAIAASLGHDEADAADVSNDLGVDILVTGAHAATDEVVNRLYQPDRRQVMEWQWERLPGEYHGSGCTLASALAAGLALGLDTIEAAGQAQELTWQALKKSLVSGRCQRLPNRIDRQWRGR